MENKWYSHSLNTEKVEGLERDLAEIEEPNAGLSSSGKFQIRFTLKYLPRTNLKKDVRRDYCELYDSDMEGILRSTNSARVSDLSGKIVETYSRNRILMGISGLSDYCN